MIEWLRGRLRGEAGYNLVEMLTVMVIMSVVFAGITDIFVAGSKAQADQDRRFQAQLGTRLAMDKIRKDIHCASDLAAGYTTSSITLKLPSGCGGRSFSEKACGNTASASALATPSGRPASGSKL